MTIVRIVILVILAQFAAPQSPPPASVRGTIRSADSGNPLAVVTVELRRINGDAAPLYTTFTSGDGTFRLDNVQPGEYRLRARLAGYIPAEFGQHRWTETGVSLNISAGQSMENTDMPLTAAGAISGRVTDKDGTPLGVTLVQALLLSYQDGQRIFKTVQSTSTNDLGEYRLFELQPGKYYVSATPPGDSNVERNPGFTRQTSFINIPGSNSAVLAQLTSNGSAPQAPIYFPGTLDMRAASPIDLIAGATVTGNNFSITPIPKRHVRGRVEGNGVYVQLAPVKPTPGQAAVPRSVDARSGTFDFADVIPGDYLVIAQSVEKEGRVRIDVRDADLNDVSVELRSGVIVSTHVTIDGHMPIENDPIFRTVRFNLTPDPPILGKRGPIYSTFPDGSVRFEVTPGEGNRIALVAVSDGPPELQNAYIKSIRMGSLDVLNNGLQFNDEPDPKIEIVLGTRTGSLSGMVLNERKQSAINTTVVLVPDVIRRGRSEAYKTATTDAAGRFQIPVIPPGDYKAFAWDDVEPGIWQDPEFLRVYEDRGTPIRIGESTKDTITLFGIPGRAPN
jgi:5-hydroxyisourate hydrolase-like protein (transthyretin family)